MDDNVIQFLNNFPLGTTLAVMIGLGGLSFGAYKLYLKFKASVKAQLQTEEENTSYKESINEIKDVISKLESKIEDYVDNHEIERCEIHDKLDKLSDAIEKEHEQSVHADELLQRYINSNVEAVEGIQKRLDVVNKKTNLLIDSDKEGIKAQITDKYYQATRVDHYIEIHTLQSLESLYEKYLEEHGNTFIGGLMKELRALPHTPPEDKNKK